MKNPKYIFEILIFASQFAMAQKPEQDCINAIPICKTQYSELQSYIGTGSNSNEVNTATSCLKGTSAEANSVWYTFTVQNSGNLSFVITPNNPIDDYDWSVFNLSGKSCKDIFNDPGLEVSCNYANFSGPTGPNGNSNFTSQGPGGTPYNALISVKANETYAILVNNHNFSKTGYVIDFGKSTAQIFDNIPPTFAGVQAGLKCKDSVITINFSENVLCNSVQPNDFVVQGPSGNISVTSITSAGCSSGKSYDYTYVVKLSSALPSGGKYYFKVTGNVEDLCQNTNTRDSIEFDLIAPNISVSQKNELCKNDSSAWAGVTVSGPGAPFSFLWDQGSTNDTIYNLKPGSYTVTISNSLNCLEKKTVLITEPSALSIATSDYSVCNGNPVFFTVNAAGGTPPYLYNFSGGGGFSSAFSAVNNPVYLYPDTGYYAYKTIVKDANNCTDSTVSHVKINAFPHAAFKAEQLSPGTYSFIDTSTSSHTSHWYFGDGEHSTAKSPEHTYKGMGKYQVMHVVTTDGCSDTSSMEISVISDYDIFIPDAFTPNSDGLNETFSCYGNGISSMNVRIFNRWGIEVFYTSDPDKAWDGKLADGSLALQGVYAYTIELFDLKGVPHYRNGRVMLVR